MQRKLTFRTLALILAAVFLGATISVTPPRVRADAQPLVGEISLYPFTFAPAGWLPCDGRLLPIAQYETLFNLILNNFGGDGQTTFALPDLRGAEPAPYVHYCIAYVGAYPTPSTGDSNAFVGEIYLLACNPNGNTPAGMMHCEGQSLAINQNQALFSLLGTTYGGNGTTNFNLPDLRNSEPLPGVYYYIAVQGIYPSQN